jgi:hypothetical protein
MLNFYFGPQGLDHLDARQSDLKRSLFLIQKKITCKPPHKANIEKLSCIQNYKS